MKKRPTLKTVAEQAGVSLPAVSQAMRGVGRISETTRTKVLKAAEEVGYIPDESAVSMRTGRSNEISIIVHFMANHFNAELINGVNSVLEPKGYLLSVFDAQNDEERLERQLRTVLSRNPAGMLWVPSETVSPGLAKLIEKQNIPNVTFLRDSGLEQITNISLSNRTSTYEATKHLIALGHQHLAYIGGMPEAQTRERRLEGFYEAIQEHNLPEPLIIDSHESKTIGFELIEGIVRDYPQYTGLMFYGDELAIGACLGLQRMGLTPGREVSIIGFDDIEEATLITPALTTISVDPFHFGQELAGLLFEEMEAQAGSPRRVMFDAVLEIRGTTAQAKS